MKTVNLSNLQNNIKYTITRDGRLGIGQYKYYSDTGTDARISDPTSHLMVNGSISIPGVTYNSASDGTTLNLHEGHYCVTVGNISNITTINLPVPSASVLHRTYVLINHNTTNQLIVTYTGASGIVIKLSNLPTGLDAALGQSGLNTGTLSTIPMNSAVIQCQRIDKGNFLTYVWRIISATYSPLNGAGLAAGSQPPAPTQYYGGITTLQLKTYQGNTIGRAIEFSNAITATVNNSAGLYQGENAAYQIIRKFTSGSAVTVNVKQSSLPTGYTFSGWRLLNNTITGVYINAFSSGTNSIQVASVNQTDPSTFTSGTTTLTLSAPNPLIRAGYAISGAGIASGTVVLSVTGTTTVNLSAQTTAVSSGSYAFTPPTFPTSIKEGWVISGQGIPANTKISTISGSNLTLSNNTSADGGVVSGTPYAYNFTSNVPSQAKTENPFTVNLIGSEQVANDDITTIDLIFTYQAPAVSSTSTSVNQWFFNPDPPFTITQPVVGGGGGGCPIPTMKIMVSLTDSVEAGSLEVGQSVWTMHETTGEWGYYKVNKIERLIQRTRLVKIGERSLIVSDSHKFLMEDGQYETLLNLKPGAKVKTVAGIETIDSIENQVEQEVVKLEIDSAHTYVVEGVVSHNKQWEISQATSGAYTAI